MWDAERPAGRRQEACHQGGKEPCGMPESPRGGARRHATGEKKSRVGCRKARRKLQEACHGEEKSRVGCRKARREPPGSMPRGGKELCGMPDKFDVRVKNCRIQ